ncbi:MULTISPECIES: porin family protein [unclassified Vibrio]|uniref:porin family protein n=1 Tax=unclassified Vibrio TaxID=2614977 RepID=UPI00159D09D1|nr:MULTISPECIES: porin family protein [unclassified Vibrio]NVN81089.1 porin family protein [Vibrio sp. Scap16]QLE95122.1 porin family protein [Vibrio sp. Scap24]
MNNKFILSIAMMSAVAANNVMAADSGFYLGGAIGTSGVDDGGMFSGNNDPVTFKAEDNTYRLIAGYRFNRIVSLELQYTDFGDVVAKFPRSGDGFTWTPQIFSAAANLGYTFDNGVRPFGTIGLSSIDLDMKNSDGSRPSGADFDDTGTGVRLGVGVEYTPTKHPEFSLRLGYEADTFTVDTYEGYSWNQRKVEKDVVLDSFYLGATYNF